MISRSKVARCGKKCFRSALGGSWRPLGASWGGKVSQKRGFRAKKEFWASTHRVGGGGSRDIQGCTKCSAEVAGGGDKGRGPMAH